MQGNHGDDADVRETPGRWTRLVGRSAAARPDLPFAFLDVVAVFGAYLTALVLRFDGRVPSEYWARFWTFLPAAIAIHLLVSWAIGLYGPVWRHAGALEARLLLLAATAAGLSINGLASLLGNAPPRSVLLVGPVIYVGLTGVVRFQSRLFAFRRSGEREPGTGLRIVVVGAGADGAAMVREMQRNPRMGLVPTAFVDDDPRLRARTICGVPVAGSLDDLANVIRRTDAHQVLVAVRAAGPELLHRVADATEQTGVVLKVLPSAEEVFSGGPSVRDARDLRIEDLLGRRETETDLDAVREMLTGRRVLITGGGGSIGSEIARQVSTFEPASLALCDNDETHLHDAVPGLETPAELLLVDVRDRRRVFDLFKRFQPDVVFHAAALKHVPMLEHNPSEAVLTNVVGTCNVLDAADEVGVDHLVFVSTDKAVQPSSVMGASKWLGEQLTMVRSRAGNRCAVRFGNVLGSRGSVVPTFTRQIMAGGPVTVTDPGMTRYFMSIPEAVQLVLQAGALTAGRDIFMLEMGEPVSIVSLAERMIRLTGRQPGVDIAIEVVGVRPGEKLVEELTRPDEATSTTRHPSILQLCPNVLGIAHLERLVDDLVAAAVSGRDEAVRSTLLSAAQVGSDHAVLDLTERQMQREGRSASWSSSTT